MDAVFKLLGWLLTAVMDSLSLVINCNYTLEEAGLSSLPVNAAMSWVATSATSLSLISPTAQASVLVKHSELEPELPTRLAGLKNGRMIGPMKTSIEFKK